MIDWPPRAQLVLRQYVTKQSIWLEQSLMREVQRCTSMVISAEDFADRIKRLAEELSDAIDQDNLPHAQFLAGQIFQLSRLAEQRLIIAIERKDAAAIIAADLAKKLPGSAT